MILENHKIDDYNDDSIVCGYCPENLGEEELKTFVPLFTVIQYDIGLLRGTRVGIRDWPRVVCLVQKTREPLDLPCLHKARSVLYINGRRR